MKENVAEMVEREAEGDCWSWSGSLKKEFKSCPKEFHTMRTLFLGIQNVRTLNASTFDEFTPDKADLLFSLPSPWTASAVSGIFSVKNHMRIRRPSL